MIVHKTMKKRISSLVIAASLLLSGLAAAFILTPLGVRAESGSAAGEVYIADGADLLTSSEEEELYGVMKPGTSYGNMVFVTIDHAMGYSASDYIEMLYQTSDTLKGTDAVIFMIDMDNRKLWISGYGGLKKVITPDYGNLITDNIYTYAGDERYKDCAVHGYEMIISRLDGERISGPLRTLGNLSIVIIFAAVLCFMLAYLMSASRKADIKAIVSGVDRNLNMGNPEIKHTRTEKIYVPPSSSGGGRSGGFSGGGGGFHGGGVGHGF